MPHTNIAEPTRRSAQRLRRKPTDAERVFWRELRRMKALGYHFRRQTPVGPYVADFACLSRKLIVELDGGHHAEGAQKHRDNARTRWLENQGYRVVRYWNNDVLNDPHVVASALLNELEAEQ